MTQKKKVRNNERIQLPNGCSCSQLTITPANWKRTDAPMNRPWLMSYRFYSPGETKAVQRRGMNVLRDRKERQVWTEALIADELALLQDGYNPILDEKIPVSPFEGSDYVIHPRTPFSEALQKAFDLFEGVSKRDLRSSLRFLQLSIKVLGFDQRPVSDIRRRHLLQVLENCGTVRAQEKREYSADRYNHFRTALNTFYKIFVKYETVEHNLVHDIEKRQHAPEPRRMITAEQFNAIDARLKIENYRFWNFVHIFFRSGARLAEVARVQGKYVDLERQSVKYQMKKGRNWRWIERPITDEALSYWQRAMINCGPEQYVFAKNLLPGDKPVDSSQYTRRWLRWVKKPKKKGKKRAKSPVWMDINLYDLKHAHTTLMAEALGEAAAAKMNGHTTTAMVRKVYNLNHKSQQDYLIRKTPIKFQ